MLLNSHIPAYATCVAGKVCSPVRSTWGTSLGEDKLGARARILNTKEVHHARARQTFSHGFFLGFSDPFILLLDIACYMCGLQECQVRVRVRGSVSVQGISFFYHSLPVPVFAPPPPLTKQFAPQKAG